MPKSAEPGNLLRDVYALETEVDTRAFYARWADEYDAQLERELRYIAAAG